MGEEKIMPDVPIMKENEMSIMGKISTILLVFFFAGAAVINIFRNHVPHPYAFIVVLSGFTLFIFTKFSNFRKGKIISFGTVGMSENMENLYRIGYWLMVVGLILTFA